MATESSVGLKKIEIADVVKTGTGIPSAWVKELKAAVIGTATFSETANTSTDIRIEQQPTGIYRRLTTEYGIKTIAVSLYDVSADNLNKLKGGTVTAAVPGTSGKKWNASREAVDIEQAVRLTTFDDFKIIIPRARLEALIDWPLTVGDLGKVAITFTALLPELTTVSDLIVEEPTPSA